MWESAEHFKQAFSKNKRSRIKVPSIVEMEIEGLTGSDPNVESKVVNPAFSGTPGDDPIIARSIKHIYKDHWTIVVETHFTLDLLMFPRRRSYSLYRTNI